MYRRTQTQYKIYGSINTHRVSREIAPDLNCSGPSVLSQAAVAPPGNEHRATDERCVTGKDVTADYRRLSYQLAELHNFSSKRFYEKHLCSAHCRLDDDRMVGHGG
jgi:hypothetical protein